MSAHQLPRWSWVFPLLACVLLGIAFSGVNSTWFLVAVAVCLGGAVFAAVHHAEVIAHRIGEPFGTLVLALAVTIIEVALILSMMLSGGEDKLALARDTVFSAIMIICNGIVGLCLLLGGLRHGEQEYQQQGVSAAMAVLTSMAVLTLVLPNYGLSEAGHMLSSKQLAFTGVVSLVLYGAFVFVQTVRHRDYFLDEASNESAHATTDNKVAIWSAGLLLVSLVAVVGLAKVLSPSIENMVSVMGAPQAVVGIIIAAMVLLPEALAATRAARANRLQTSLNLALGSGLASIGLTIPAVALIFVITGQPLVLGLEMKETVLLGLTLLVGSMSLATGKTTILQGVVHLVLFATFLFFAVSP
ncbi:calcium:proton antiporter [Craterilacuibacter sp.]|uniref:calcium:proton antiporter n=1 Tax=Craterilacuibacter sp. TaxID=2870909 RepID=UPI003F2DE405